MEKKALKYWKRTAFINREKELRDLEVYIDEELLGEMVRSNILYFDPTLAVYYPQGRSFHRGIRLYFEE